MKNISLIKTSQVYLKCVSCGSSTDFNTLEDKKIQCKCGKEYLNQKELEELNIKSINIEMKKLEKEGIKEIKEKVENSFFNKLQNTFKGNKYFSVYLQKTKKTRKMGKI
ncbi:MAG: hypothetical protein PHF86_01195 [Candidatus Nanoarchaeia archaeon]|nr:hypothetical protein [Candidatus Nanoarchaeia archaeon]